jgi:hypothetical protein
LEEDDDEEKEGFKNSPSKEIEENGNPLINI